MNLTIMGDMNTVIGNEAEYITFNTSIRND